MARRLRSLTILVLALSCHSLAEDTIIVHVGLQGSFYSPIPVFAQLNDIIRFVFDGPLHDVTQSSFENPCEPLAGGFSSGLAGRGVDGNGLIPVWDLRVTNVTAPIWFYCGASVPVPHCTTGMVGAINPPSLSIFNTFQSHAKKLSFPSPLAAPLVVLTGHGAFATISPSVPSSVSSAAPPSPSTSTVSSTAPTLTDSPSTSSESSRTDRGSTIRAVGSIVGAAVGGGVGLLATCSLSFIVYQAIRRGVPSVIHNSDARRPLKSMVINQSPSDLEPGTSDSERSSRPVIPPRPPPMPDLIAMESLTRSPPWRHGRRPTPPRPVMPVFSVDERGIPESPPPLPPPVSAPSSSLRSQVPEDGSAPQAEHHRTVEVSQNVQDREREHSGSFLPPSPLHSESGDQSGE